MTQIILNSAMRSMLGDLRQPVELCDESGTILARIIPVLDVTQYEQVEPQLSAEELQRRKQEPTYSTAEVLTYLEKC